MQKVGKALDFLLENDCTEMLEIITRKVINVYIFTILLSSESAFILEKKAAFSLKRNINHLLNPVLNGSKRKIKVGNSDLAPFIFRFHFMT